jgi:hypothetical protein
MKRWFPEGSWTAGDIALTYDESQMDLSIYDWVLPFGAGTSKPGAVDAPTFQYKELVTRAATTSTLAGTVTSAGSSITGNGTQFTSQLLVGDVLVVAGTGFVVETIVDDTHLTLTTSPSPSWHSIGFARGLDRVIMAPIARVVQVRDTNTVYTASDFAVAADLGGLDWSNPSTQPAMGAAYSLSYHYYPTYQVTEYGQRGRVVDGRPELSVVMCTLLRPDTQAR